MNRFMISCCILTAVSLSLLYMVLYCSSQTVELRKEPTQCQETSSSYRAEDLAMYYELYQRASPEEQKVIRQIIVENFSSFDKEQLVNGALKQFLVNQRREQ